MAKKPVQPTPESPSVPWDIEPVVEGGHFRRIHFDGRHVTDPPAPAAAPAPEQPLVEFRAREAPLRHHDSMETIHEGIDHIRRHQPRARQPTVTRTLYETPGGAVREAVLSTPEGRQRLLYVSRTREGREVEERFSPARVDRIIQDVALEAPPAAPAAATAQPLAEAPAAMGAPAAAPANGEAKPKRGFLGLFRRRKPEEATQDYLPVQVVDEAPLPAPQPLAEAPAWSPPAGEAAPIAAPSKPKAPRRKAKPRAARKPVPRKAPARKARKAPKPRTHLDYKGDRHLVIELEGIGPTYAKRLQNAGIHTTDRLCYEKAARIAAKAKVPAKTARTWQSMAQLAKVKGIGPQYAEALARAGIRGIDGLKAGTPKGIATKVGRYLAGLQTNVIGTGVTAKRVAAWQRAARRMRKLRLPVPPTGPPEATTWYEKARAEAADREMKAGLRAKRTAARKGTRRRR